MPAKRQGKEKMGISNRKSKYLTNDHMYQTLNPKKEQLVLDEKPVNSLYMV